MYLDMYVFLPTPRMKVDGPVKFTEQLYTIHEKSKVPTISFEIEYKQTSLLPSVLRARAPKEESCLLAVLSPPYPALPRAIIGWVANGRENGHKKYEINRLYHHFLFGLSIFFLRRVSLCGADSVSKERVWKSITNASVRLSTVRSVARTPPADIHENVQPAKLRSVTQLCMVDKIDTKYSPTTAPVTPRPGPLRPLTVPHHR